MKIVVRSDAKIPLSWESGTDRVAYNVLNIIRMWQGEAAFARPMGVETPFAGMPAAQVAGALSASIRANIGQYEPDANVLYVRVIPDGFGVSVIEVAVEVDDNA